MARTPVLHLFLCLGWPWFATTASTEGDWPVPAHDAARSGATATEIRPPFERKWYRLFPGEGLMAGVQAVVSEGKVLLGTMVGASPIVPSEGQVLVKFRTLLRSRYEHYSPFLNVGYLDTSSGNITPIMGTDCR